MARADRRLLHELEKQVEKGSAVVTVSVPTKGFLRPMLIGDKHFDERISEAIEFMARKGYSLQAATGVGFVQRLVFQRD